MAARKPYFEVEMSPPFEILELPAGASVEFKVERWETGWMDIRPRWPGAPATKRVRVIRVHVPAEYKPLFPHYWDLTPGTLVAQMIPILERPDFRELLIKITAVGMAPKKRFTVTVTPAAAE